MKTLKVITITKPNKIPAVCMNVNICSELMILGTSNMSIKFLEECFALF